MAVDPKALKDILGWDVRSWSRALYSWDRHLEKMDRPLKGLELGGNKGGLSLWLGMNGVDVICSDLQDSEKNAKPLHLKYRQTGIRYQDLSALELPFENELDIVVFKSILGAINRENIPGVEARVFQQIHKALKPGGRLFFAENMQASALHRKLRKKFVPWGGGWNYLSQETLEECLSPFSEVEYRTTGFLATMGRSEGQRNFLSLLDSMFFNALMPSQWRYLGFGTAVK